MVASLHGRRPVALLLAGLLAYACALPPAAFSEADPPKPGGPEPSKDVPVVRGLDDLKNLPPGAVIVICEDYNTAKRFVPKGVLLTAEQYKALLDQIADLKAQLKPEKAAPPGVCVLTGQADGNLVRLHALFKFDTTAPNAVVPLGCAQGNPTEASLDGKLPALQYTSDGGFTVTVPEAGSHVLKLDLELGLVAKGSDRGFDLDLPRAGVTTLSLELPEDVPEVHVGRTDPTGDARGKAWTQPTVKSADGKSTRLETGALGPVSRVELAWKGPTPLPGATTLLAAEARATVRVAADGVTTDLELTLKVLRGQAVQWNLLLPPQVELVTPITPDGPIKAFTKPAGKNLAHVLQLTKSRSEPLTVVFRVRQPRGDGPLPIGPFAVLGAFTQSGSVVVTAPPTLTVNYQLPAAGPVTVGQRELTDEERKLPRAVAAFNYQVTPLPPPGPNPTTVPPVLQLDVENARTLPATQTRHKLELAERGAWRLTTEIEVNPGPDAARPGAVAEPLQIQLPLGYTLTPGQAGTKSNPGLRLDHDAAARTLTVVPVAKKGEPFKVAFEGTYPPPAMAGDGLQQVALDLPAPRKTEDRAAQVTVMLPREMELLAPVPADPAWEGLPPGRSEYTYRTDRSPERAEVAWRLSRPEAAVTAVADVTLSWQRPGAGAPGQGWVTVRQRFTFASAQPAGPMTLWVPDALPGGGEAVKWWTSDRPNGTPHLLAAPAADAAPKRAGFRAWVVQPSAPFDKEHALVLEYSFALPSDNGGRVSVPLLVPDQTPRLETKVRVYADPGVLPALANSGPWEEAPAERGERETLPALVLRGHHPDQAAVLQLSGPTVPLARVVVDSALFQVTVTDAPPGHETQKWHARYLIQRLYARFLDVELPAPAAALTNFKVTLQPGDDPAQVAEVSWGATDDPSGRVIRLALAPELVRKPAVLDFTFQVTPERRFWGSLQSVLTPPLLHGETVRAPVRWQVGLLDDRVPLDPDGGLALEQHWGWRGWLPALQPSTAGDEPERWFQRQVEAAAGVKPAEEVQAAEPMLAWSAAAPETVRLYHLPQQGWLLGCSLGVLVGGLLVYLAGLSLVRPLLAPRAKGEEKKAAAGGQRLRVLVLVGLAVVLTTAGVTAAVLWPGALGVLLYGALPGAAALALVVSVQWLLHQRYRRQVVFMPGFTRLKSNSSLLRTGPRAEPSTVDAPPAS
jgi:hypothetical protein